MSLFSQITDGMVQTDAEGRRIFCFGTRLTGRRCVYVTAEQERNLRRTYEAGVVGLILAFGVWPSRAWWTRIGAMVPVWVIWAIVMLITLRRKTAALPAAPEFPRPSQRQLAISGARALGRPLLWIELIFLLAVGVIAVSPVMPYDELGWQKYGAAVIGFSGSAYVAYQLYLLRKL